MWGMWRVCVAVVAVMVAASGGVDWAAEEAARQLLREYHEEAGEVFNNSTKIAWDFNTNITQHNKERQKAAAARSRQFNDAWNKRSRAFLYSDLTNETRRLMKKAFRVQLNEEDGKNMTQLLSTMSTIYATGQVCLPGKDCLTLDPGLSNIMAKSRNYTELRDVWQGWRFNVSRKIKPHYLQYLQLMNKGARLNNYTDAGHRWRASYETPKFEEQMVQLYRQVEPLYRLVHAYVRKRLREHYPDQIDPRGPLPACVLGDMWGRFWTNIADMVTPHPEQPPLDITPRLRALSHTATSMFKMGDDFFTSMGLKPVPDTFWTRSMLVKPEGRQVVCHPTAWDFYDGKDFRIKMCSQVTMEDLQTIHHELGHVQYFMQYAHLPLTYRDGANDGFHEAVGELVGLVMATPQHLANVGLLDHSPRTHEMTINHLMWMALQTVTTLPFHLVHDLWRWKVWRGEVEESEYNNVFWKLKLEYTGVAPPVARTGEDLDPPALFHVANSYDMIRYFTRTILQFQILEGLCKEAGHEGPLHTCDLYGSKDAGRLLASGLSLGSSRPWPEVLHILTGSFDMDPEPFLRFFAPLEDWLKKEGLRPKQNGGKEGTGWGNSWRELPPDVSSLSSVSGIPPAGGMSAAMNYCGRTAVIGWMLVAVRFLVG